MEEGSGLESLINQRLTRPSYTRMVSWEFSNQPEAIPVKRKRRRSKKQSDVDEEVDISVFASDEEQDGHSSLTESDEDCLYFSAEETISLESDSADKIYQKIASLDIDETSDKDTTLGDDGDDSLADVQSPPQKKHAPSKKQKRKRRKSKNSYVWHAGDFLSAMEINIEPDIIFDTQELVEESRIYVEKAVPSLVELCLNCTRRRKLNVQLPKGLKNMVKHSNKEFTFRKFQVSWLQNEFSKWQPFEEKKRDFFFAVYQDDDEWGSDPVYKCVFPTTNIWNNVFYPKHLNSRYLDEYDGSKTSSFLPFTFITNPNAWENNFDGIKYIFQQRFLGCLANLVDLMMPSILSERKAGTESDRYKSELDQISATTKTAMMRVKGALSVRFRDITDLFFDKTIPYVFWARGDFHLAANLFTKLIEGEKRSRWRAMYMVEIARMHAQQGEPETASRFYRMAADITLEKGKALKDDKEVTGQMLMLLASIYDQGMMTSKSDRTAAEHWRYVVTSGTFNRGAANMAAISMLCFHSRPSCDTEPSSFVEVRRRLEVLAEKCPKFLYYISLLQALAGEDSDAENSFKTYKQREQAEGNSDGPGLSMNISSSAGNRRKRQSFWQSLSAMVSKSGHPQPLHVLWRSHLQPLRVCDPTSHFPPTEADLCCDNLDLRLNSQGYLTGNMKLMLPPIRSVNLNPYTGKLCFPRTPGSTEVWTTMDRFLISSDIDEEDHDTGLIPCPLEVYRDEDGTTVQMMLPATLEKYANSYSQTNTHAAALTFFWSDDKGQTARLSVLATFWRLIYEKLGLRFKREALQGKKSEQWLEDCLKVLKFCLDTKRELDYEWITRVVDYDIVEARKKNSKLSIVKFLTSLNDTCLPELLWSRNYTCYGKTLVLGFDFSRWNITVFLDCSSRDSFLQPDIRLEAGNTHIPDIPNSKNHKLAGAEIYYLRYTKNKENTQHFKVCGEKGNVLERIDMEDDGSDDHLPYVIGSSLLIITFRSRLWCWNDYKIKVDKALPPLQKITPTDCSVVMVTLRDSAVFRFVNTPSLESVPIRTNCNLIEPFKITEDGLEFKAAFSDFKVLSTCSKTENDHSFQEVILGMDTNLVTIHILEKDEKGLAEVIITDILPLPGTPVEHCYIGKNDGFLVTWTQQYDSNKDYEENLFYFNKESELLGVLPCLGKGPRSFSPLYLPGDPDTQTDFPGYGLPGWYVYMRDGHDGIIGVKLPIQHRTS